jgi:hypothetical protein
MTPTWDIIVPIKDSEGRIVDWKLAGRVLAATLDDAIRFAKRNYGLEADIQSSSGR